MAHANPYKGTEHKVPARNEPRVLVEVDVEPQNGATICGQHLHHGKRKVIVYRSELDALMARVRTPEHEALLRAAERAHDVALDQHLAPKFGRDWRTNPDPKLRAAIDTAIARFGESSVWSQFDRLNRGGMPPLKSAVVLEEVPAPDTPEARSDRADGRMEQMISMLVEAIAGKQAQPATSGGKR